MEKIILDLRRTSDRSELHDILAGEFGFPEYYGRNLDAVYDLLTERTTETCVGVYLPAFVYAEDEDGISRPHAFNDVTGDAPAYLTYLKRFCRLLEDVEKENPHFAVFLIPGTEDMIHEVEI